MRKLTTYFTMVAVILMTQGSAFAATVVKAVSVNASIQSALDLEMTIIQHEGATDTTVSTMNFGSLTPNPFGGMDSGRFFTVFLTGRTQQLPYVITQTGTSLNNGAATMPNGAQNLAIVYATQDNGGQPIPTGAALGTNGTWVATNKTVYDSENANAQQRTVQAIYGLRGDPALGPGNFVPPSQPSGNYTAQITYTLTA